MEKYLVKYYRCGHCGFIQTEAPYWLDEAYGESINITDTGIIRRNLQFGNIVASLLYLLFNQRGRYLDYAGGYGIFTRIMRDIGFDFYWQDKHTQNLVARGFEFCGETPVELLTSFEVFEHFVQPLDEIEKMLSLSGTLLFSTMLIPKHLPKPGKWWYYGLEHGQHIALYEYKTLVYIAKKYGLNLCSNKKNIHMFSKKRVSPFWFKMIVLLGRVGFGFYVKTRMQSKTQSDMDLLLNRK
ncbi:class I SAM-dependent methyltransferase [bacterium AH-315-E07]|nr:class I SAM-dependent methyltransferase [bacterium AH-315-E07]